jgi:hypothetical protein
VRSDRASRSRPRGPLGEELVELVARLFELARQACACTGVFEEPLETLAGCRGACRSCARQRPAPWVSRAQVETPPFRRSRRSSADRSTRGSLLPWTSCERHRRPSVRYRNARDDRASHTTLQTPRMRRIEALRTTADAGSENTCTSIAAASVATVLRSRTRSRTPRAQPLPIRAGASMLGRHTALPRLEAAAAGVSAVGGVVAPGRACPAGVAVTTTAPQVVSVYKV